jgi:hypothetical protein
MMRCTIRTRRRLQWIVGSRGNAFGAKTYFASDCFERSALWTKSPLRPETAA